MKAEVNGEPREIELGQTVYGLLVDLQLDPEQKGMAVAVDQEVVLRRDWEETRLRPGSRIEIIRAVAGG